MKRIGSPWAPGVDAEERSQATARSRLAPPRPLAHTCARIGSLAAASRAAAAPPAPPYDTPARLAAAADAAAALGGRLAAAADAATEAAVDAAEAEADP